MSAPVTNPYVVSRDALGDDELSKSRQMMKSMASSRRGAVATQASIASMAVETEPPRLAAPVAPQQPVAEDPLKKAKLEIPTEEALKHQQLNDQVKAYLEKNLQHAAPQSLGQPLTVVSPDGGTLTLSPRAPLEPVKMEVSEKKIPEIDLSKIPEEQRAGILALQKEAQRDRMVVEAVQRKQLEELSTIREVVQKQLNEFLGPLVAQLEARDKLPVIQAGVNDAISRGSLVGLDAFDKCIQTLAKSEENRKHAHSLLQETHKDKLKMEEQFKEALNLVSQQKNRIDDLERRLAEISAKTSVPMYATHDERLQPVAQPQQFMPQLLTTTAAAPVMDSEDQLIRNVLRSTLRVEDLPAPDPEALFRDFESNLVNGYRNNYRGFKN